MISEVPTPRPVTLPDPSTLAADVLDDHVPPLTASDSAIVAPIQTLSGPVISGGGGPTETVFDAEQPEPPNENTIVVEPKVRPVTKPVEVTVATAGTLLVHVPVPPAR